MARVYVSSTLADLVDERRAVMDWLTAAGHQPVHSYQPDSGTIRDSCLTDVDTCDLYVLILGHRYGFQPQDNPGGLSITHLEFRRARESKIPCVVLCRKSVPDISLSDLLNPEKASKVRAFHDEVVSSVRSAEFLDLMGLMVALSTGINRELEKLPKKAGQTTTATDESRYFSAIEMLIRQLDQKDAENTALRQTVIKLQSELQAALPPSPAGVLPLQVPTPAVFKHAKNEAVVVGSSLVAFVAGVSAGHREAILNSLLLAQLVASKQVEDQTQLHEWYQTYSHVLSNIGWNLQETLLQRHDFCTVPKFDLYEEVLKVAATKFQHPTALSAVKTAIHTLYSQNESDPAMILFDRESCHGHTARFHIALAEQSEIGNLTIDLLGFGLMARSAITRVLRFESKNREVALYLYSTRASMDTAILTSVREIMAAKLGDRTLEYVRKLPDSISNQGKVDALG